MAWGSYHSGGGRRSPSVSQKKNVMISTHVRAVTHQTTKHSLHEGEIHISQKEVLYGDRILPQPRQPWFYRDCMPRGQGLPWEGLQSSVGASQGISYQVSFAMSLAVGLHTFSPSYCPKCSTYLGGHSDSPELVGGCGLPNWLDYWHCRYIRVKHWHQCSPPVLWCSQVSGSDYSLYTKHSSHHHLWRLSRTESLDKCPHPGPSTSPPDGASQHDLEAEILIRKMLEIQALQELQGQDELSWGLTKYRNIELVFPNIPSVTGDLQDVEATVLWLSCLDEKSEVFACKIEAFVETVWILTQSSPYFDPARIIAPRPCKTITWIWVWLNLPFNRVCICL